MNKELKEKLILGLRTTIKKGQKKTQNCPLHKTETRENKLYDKERERERVNREYL